VAHEATLKHRVIMIISKKHVMTSLGLVLTIATANVFAYTGQSLAGEAKISIEQARLLAIKAQPGKIVDEELEREEGGTGLRYSFDIRHDKGTQEVGIDAITGELLETYQTQTNLKKRTTKPTAPLRRDFFLYNVKMTISPPKGKVAKALPSVTPPHSLVLIYS